MNKKNSIDQHNEEIHENLRHWNKKPQLQAEYKRFYQRIASKLDNLPQGDVLECGSGIGNIKTAFPQAITSDLFPNPWLDRQENIYKLNFADNSLSAVVLFDVFHHLQFPGNALKELYRTVNHGGRVIIFEPSMGLFGRMVLGLFHHEPLGFSKPISWSAPADFDPGATKYYAAQGNAWRIFDAKEKNAELSDSGWLVKEISYFPALAWLLTGGFRGPSLYPASLKFMIKFMDRALSLSSRFFSARMIVVLEKPSR